MKKILVFDNYDSFTYNLVHCIANLTNDPIDVFRNDEIAIQEIAKYDRIVLSPGPGIPDEAGLLKDLINEYASTKSIFGVCLGMQAIAEVFGGSLYNLDSVFHGVATTVSIIKPDEKVFRNIPQQFLAGRYHSWAVSNNEFPDSLTITSKAEKGEIMSIRHKKFDVCGVQFHPESVLTEYGSIIIKNWLNK